MSQCIAEKYHVIEKIAKGGMAEILLAEHTGLGGFKKRIVIKKILPHLVGDEKFIRMFQDEARVAAMLSHTNIVTLFDFGQDGEEYFIAMEYVPGFTLREVIKISNQHSLWLAPEYIAKLGSQICEGLEYAHNFTTSDNKPLNLIHRDISPQNIILSTQGVLKIVDFGVAKASSNEQKTQAGIIKGKLAYMSPEQVKGQKLDNRSDIFSLGILLYELTTHKRPFSGKTDMEMLRAVLETEPVPLSSLRPNFPMELQQIIMRALQKDRDKRYSSAGEMLFDLENFIQSYGKPIGPFQLRELVQHLEAKKEEIPLQEQDEDRPATTNLKIGGPQTPYIVDLGATQPSPVISPLLHGMDPLAQKKKTTTDPAELWETSKQSVVPSVPPTQSKKPSFDESEWDDPTIMNPHANSKEAMTEPIKTDVSLSASQVKERDKATEIDQVGLSPSDINSYLDQLQRKESMEELHSKATVGLESNQLPPPPAHLQDLKNKKNSQTPNSHNQNATNKATKIPTKKTSKIGIFLVVTVVAIVLILSVFWYFFFAQS